MLSHTACGWQELIYSPFCRSSPQGARYESGLVGISGGDAKVTSQAISKHAGMPTTIQTAPGIMASLY